MKNILYIGVFSILIGTLSGLVFAQQGDGTGAGMGQGSGNGMKLQDPSTHDGVAGDGSGQGNQMQNQNQVNTQNMGEDSMLQVSTSFGGSNKSDNAKAHMSNVAQAVEEFLASGNKNGGIGKEISDIAKTQQQAQVQIGKTLDKLEARKGLVKKLIGPNTDAIDEMKKLMAQNQVRIQQMQELKNQVQNQGEDTQLQEMIQAMVDQNTALQSQVQAEEGVKGIFGWLARFFN